MVAAPALDSGLSDGADVADQKSFLQAMLSQSSELRGAGGVISRAVNDITQYFHSIQKRPLPT